VEQNDLSWRPRITLYEDGKREECNHSDIVMATNLLTQFAKAHADVLMGRGGNGILLTPLDLFADENSDEVGTGKAMLQTTARELQSNNVVKIPVIKDTSTGSVLKVKITEDIPDPTNLGIKAGVNWSFRCGQKLLPACADDESEVDSEEAELSDHEYEAACQLSSFHPHGAYHWCP
jgi:hypothetical protein